MLCGCMAALLSKQNVETKFDISNYELDRPLPKEKTKK